MRFLLIISSLAVLLSSCASYRQQSADYYANLEQGDYARAEKALDKNRLLKKKRNRLLLLLEKGKLAHVQGKWEESNRYFNQADNMMESDRNTFGDVALSNLLNPMMKHYRAEDFEKYLVHYYKALNYLQLNNREEALVEARRITLRTYMQEDKTDNKNRYKEDAFSFSLQGMIYEVANDINNAFIAYRNAVDLYLESNGKHYGTSLPQQLKKDLLRTAALNGFSDQVERYEQLLGLSWQPPSNSEGGELVIFWENGSAPVKVQEDFFFSLAKGAGGSLFFSDSRGMYNHIPFDIGTYPYRDNISLTDLRGFRVALPRYESKPSSYSHAVVKLGDKSFVFEKAEDINTLAISTLNERMLRELTQTLTRMAIKKLSEAALRNAGSSGSNNNANKSDAEKKKDKKKENQREALAMGLQLFNLATEKADTRNWQSLPQTIYYTRVPLQKGENKLTITFQGANAASQTITVNGNGGLQFMNLAK